MHNGEVKQYKAENYHNFYAYTILLCLVCGIFLFLIKAFGCTIYIVFPILFFLES